MLSTLSYKQLALTFLFQAGNHFVWEFHVGKTLNVPASYGLLHHYRVCEFGGKLLWV